MDELLFEGSLPGLEWRVFLRRYHGGERTRFAVFEFQRVPKVSWNRLDPSAKEYMRDFLESYIGLEDFELVTEGDFAGNGDERFLDGLIGELELRRRRGESVIGIHPRLGFTSQASRSHDLTFNFVFFLMNADEISSPYSLLGEPHTGVVQNGKVVVPSVYGRPSLIVGEDGVRCEELGLESLEIRGMDVGYVFKRPEYEITPDGDGLDVVVVGKRVVSVKRAGGTPVPLAGFVLRTDEFEGVTLEMNIGEGIIFSVEGMPCLIKDGAMVEIEWTDGIPPTVFPRDYSKTPAARTALGYGNGKFTLVIVEGANSSEYVPGLDSRGFTLEELAQVMMDLGVETALNLDGGGSSQVYIRGGKVLKWADRHGREGVEYERPIPMYMYI